MNNQQDTRVEGEILIVDDTRNDLRILSQMLTEQGYTVRTAVSGARALVAARLSPPDLILLDIKLPDMNGYEVCARLREGVQTQEIPVIFISVLDEVLDKVRAFAVGGVDYISKPFQLEEVLARVENHLTLRQLQKRLVKQNTLLQKKNEQMGLLIASLEEKNEQLHKLNASKDRFFSIIAHDLRGPFTSLLGFVEVMVSDLDEYSREEIETFVKRIQISARTVFKLLENLLTWSILQRDAVEYYPSQVSLNKIVLKNLGFFTQNARYKEIELTNLVPEDMMVYADHNMVDTIIRNLLSNALKFTGSGGEVQIAARPVGDYVEVSVSDTGVGMSQARQESLFQLNMEVEVGTAGEKGAGLGLTLCKELVEINHGTFKVESKENEGTTVTFTLPTAPAGQLA